MKFKLPRFIKNPCGFTLIELMVVISIIAILAVVGIVIFGNAQSKARDGRRKADIDSIADALETNKPAGSLNYPSTELSDVTKLFSGGVIPTDPKVGESYCITVDYTNPPLLSPPANAVAGSGGGQWSTRGTCPSGPPAYAAFSTSSLNNGGSPAGPVSTWTICALLEANSNGAVYCRSSRQ